LLVGGIFANVWRIEYRERRAIVWLPLYICKLRRITHTLASFIDVDDL
jgi:hypothetical protein